MLKWTVYISTYRLRQWTDTDQHHSESIPQPSENLPNGTSLSRKDWVALNRARAKTGRTGDNLFRWGLVEDPHCVCGEPVQTMDHILRDCPEGMSCSDGDLLEANQSALDWLSWGRDKIWMNVYDDACVCLHRPLLFIPLPTSTILLTRFIYSLFPYNYPLSQ